LICSIELGVTESLLDRSLKLKLNLKIQDKHTPNHTPASLAYFSGSFIWEQK